MFQFDRVYSPGDSQESMFEEVRPLLTSVLDGYNVCIMAYGQTGSGKTYTMFGPHSKENFILSPEPQLDEGIVPKAARELYKLMSNKPFETHSVKVSIVEVYNNELIDLLAKDDDGTVLGIKRDVVTTITGASDVPSLTYEHVENPTSILNLITHGLQHRTSYPTLVHAHSSRSHLVITITITTKVTAANRSEVQMKSTSESNILRPLQRQSCKQLSSPIADNNSAPLSRSLPAKHFSTESAKFPEYLETKLQLVDLAGSECVGMSGVTGTALRETSFINRSLSALSDVLGALAEHRSHVPYRNSKLTRLLQDSIGGDAKLLVIVCVSPAQKYTTESMQSLGFGIRARQVQKGHVRKKSPVIPGKIKLFSFALNFNVFLAPFAHLQINCTPILHEKYAGQDYARSMREVPDQVRSAGYQGSHSIRESCIEVAGEGVDHSCGDGKLDPNLSTESTSDEDPEGSTIEDPSHTPAVKRHTSRWDLDEEQPWDHDLVSTARNLFL
ncbi:kinesin-like protein KIF25 [Cetorhinus maximus]